MPTVLIVDDEDDMREFLRMILEDDGFAAEEASDGLSGVEKAIELIPDLVLLDIVMPGCDGWEVVKRLRADRYLKETPVILISGCPDSKDIYKQTRPKGCAFIPKPFEISALRRQIHAFLDAGESRREPLKNPLRSAI